MEDEYQDSELNHEENIGGNIEAEGEISKVFYSTAYYTDRLDLSRKVLLVYNSWATIFGWPRIQPRHVDLIAYYIYYGYNEETQARYMEDFNIPSGTMSVMNSELKKSGMLSDFGGNYKTRDICPRLKRFRQYFVDGHKDPKRMVIDFFRKKP